MGKTKMELREQINRYEENAKRINEIADACEKEKRERTEQEDTEYRQLLQQQQLIEMRMHSLAAKSMTETADNTVENANKLLRENVAAGRQTRIMLCRDMVMVATAQAGGIVPVKIQDILDPLNEGLILSKLGLPMPTGLAGDYVWPVYEAVDASINGEGVALSDTPITMSKLTAKPERIGIAIPVTREAINQTEGIIETIVRRLMPMAVSRLLNKIMLGVDKVGTATSLVGPFVALKESAITTATKEPTFKELNALKAKVLESGVDGENMCWVMTAANKCLLEATPKDPGSGIMICENDMIAGLPVFTSHYIGEEYIGLGDWRYQPCGLFGEISFIVDPYSQARKNAVDFVLNANFGTTTLRKEAFVLAKLGA